jgi:hypothetical protein
VLVEREDGSREALPFPVTGVRLELDTSRARVRVDFRCDVTVEPEQEDEASPGPWTMQASPSGGTVTIPGPVRHLSAEAAADYIDQEALERLTASGVEDDVIRAIRDGGPSTATEVAKRLGRPVNDGTVRRALVRLRDAGHIRSLGESTTQRTPIWEVTDPATGIDFPRGEA